VAEAGTSSNSDPVGSQVVLVGQFETIAARASPSDGKERDASARRLRQVIKESCHNDLARHFDEVDCETQLKQAPVVSMLVAVAAALPSTTRLPLTNPWANIPVSMVRRGEEIKGTGNSGLESSEVSVIRSIIS
jgi:hypothetical protein